MRHGGAVRIGVFVLCLIFLPLVTGCETVKGAGRDFKKVDQWIRDHWW